MFEVLLVVLLCTVGFTITTWRYHAQTGRLWEQVRQTLELESGTRSGRRRVELQGEFQAFDVEVSRTPSTGRHAGRANRIEVRIDSRGAIPESLTILPASLGRRLGRALGMSDTPTGDPEFDRDFIVRGRRADALALFDRATRSRVRRRLESAQGTVEQGRVTVFPEVKRDATQMASTIRDTVAFAKTLCLAPGEVVARLARNAAKEASATARHGNLAALLRSYPDSPEARSAVQAALDDDSAAVRLLAAKHLGEAGFATTREIALSFKAATEVRLEAIEHLVEHFPAERALAGLGQTSSIGNVAVRCAALRALGRIGTPEAVALLHEHVSDPNADAAKAVARALGDAGSPASEGHLVGLLARDDPEVQVAAATALGTLGTIMAVEPLLALTQGVLSGRAGRAAERAVAAIQRRLGEVESGALAVVADERSTGQLSLNEAEGNLSVVQEGAKEPS